MRDAKLSIAPDARAALVSLIGGDRQASRSEIRKLALYAHGKERVTLDDVVAVVADASALALDAVVDAAFAGRAPETESQFSKALSAGTSSGTIMSWALRYVTQLHKARVSLDAGDDAYAAMRSFVPPIHFRREAMVQTALKTWTAPRLQRASAAKWRRLVANAGAPPKGCAERAGATRPALARRVGAAPVTSTLFRFRHPSRPASCGALGG